MKPPNKLICRLSILLNIILIVFILALGIRFKRLITDKFFNSTGTAKIVLFGDSIIRDANWSELLERNDIQNSGFPGLTTGHLLYKVKENVLVHNPEICVLQGGVNDVVVGVPTERINENFRQILDTLLAHDIIPIVQSTIYQENDSVNNIKIDAINTFLLEFCLTHQIAYIDINSLLSSDDGLRPENSTDGTHLSEWAYEIWSKEISSILQDLDN